MYIFSEKSSESKTLYKNLKKIYIIFFVQEIIFSVQKSQRNIHLLCTESARGLRGEVGMAEGPHTLANSGRVGHSTKHTLSG